MRPFITLKTTWIHYDISESKQQSKQRVEEIEEDDFPSVIAMYLDMYVVEVPTFTVVAKLYELSFEFIAHAPYSI